MITQNTASAKKVSKKEDTATNNTVTKLYMKIPLQDSDWALQQKSSVHQLWMECWRADQYGTRFMRVETKLKKSAFAAAKKILHNAGLFLFKPEKSTDHASKTLYWTVLNLHGASRDEYWDYPQEPSIETRQVSTQMESPSMQMETFSVHMENSHAQMEISNVHMETKTPETVTEQSIGSPSILSKTNSNDILLEGGFYITQTPPPTPKTLRVCEEEIEENGFEEIEISEEAIAAAQQQALEIEEIYYRAQQSDPADVKMAFDLMSIYHNEPTIYMKAAMIGTPYESTLRYFAKLNNWKLPYP